MKQLYWRFYKAARRGDADTVVRLLQSNPELHSYEGQAGTVLEILDRKAPELLEPAFRAGLSPNAEPSRRCQTLLQQAASEGDVDRLRLLIRYGADLERRNHSGEVALGYACSWEQLEAVKILVEAGADVNCIEADPETGYRNTPLDCAHRYPEIAAYLRSKGAKYLEELEGGTAGAPSADNTAL
ncbi:MAG TPA: ankyrin repeat domain-containing protein [Armatimonadota bacterium]|nr:ankyrin repeat domain-containing protein [Armatimonadota bacterium]